jgi:photosynthetic reaction center cytochrome c subunit
MKLIATLALAIPALLLAGCEVGTKVVSQTGPNGAGTFQVVHKATMAKVGVVPQPPYPLTPDMLEGPKASETYQNVKVLGDLSTEEFNYTMAAITSWIAPDDGTVKNGGCNYCHNPANMASDEIYTKVVARKMLAMTRNINTTWRPHFQASLNGGNAGVTCWTCHRGQPVPKYNWSAAMPDPATITGNKFGQNTPAMSVAYASLPNDPFTSLLAGKDEIRVQNAGTYPAAAHKVAIQSTEKTYGLMMHMSQGLGVNCTYCHNTQNFANWSQSRTQRVSAWYGIRMVRDSNNNYITALGSVWPANRLGPAGDPKKIYCTTCHQGVNKPLGGYPMLKDYPGLKGPYHSDGAAPAPAAAPVSTPVAAADTAKSSG